MNTAANRPDHLRGSANRRLGIIRGVWLDEPLPGVNPFKALFRSLVDRAGRSYITGPHLADAIDRATALSHDGLGVTLAYWNDVGEDARKVGAAYVEAAEALAAAGISGSVAVKTPALAS